MVESFLKIRQPADVQRNVKPQQLPFNKFHATDFFL